MPRQSVAAEARQFTRRWAAALAEAASPPRDPDDVERALQPLVGDLLEAVRGDSRARDTARDVGMALVEANFRNARSLNRTITLLGTGFAQELGEVLGLDDEAAAAKIAAVQGAVAEGFSLALRGRMLRERHTTQAAALAAARASESRRRTSEARFRAVFTEASVGIAIVDSHGLVIEANAALAEILGSADDACTGLPIADVIADELPATVRANLAGLLAGETGRFRTECVRTSADGRSQRLDVTLSAVTDDEGELDFLIGVVVDLSECRALEAQLWHEARHDELTGLPNRKLFLERLASTERLAGLCYVDLDGFKSFNDGLGHDTGDRLLIAVTNRLRQAAVDDGVLIARLGGDEFVLLIEEDGTDADRVTHYAERTLDALAAPIRIGEDEYRVTASIGVVHTATAGRSPSELMRAADISLQRAKALGRARWERYDPDRGAEEATKHELATAIPLALSRGEFVLDYQPMVTLPDPVVSGFEALVRWRHPQLGLLGPDRFIPLAEQTGHIVALGRWVLEQACAQARRWYDDFRDVPVMVSVNVAATQLREASFVADVLGALHDAGLPADRLQLELTESAVAGDTSCALAALSELAAAGVSLAIDDFGTGYSNLAHLGRLPVHTLKIDRSFLSPVRPGGPTDPAHDKIVAATISLAHSLGLDVAAEGVETPAQVEALRVLHCDSAQGFLFGAPASADDATTLLAHRIATADSA
ncbi:putative bifunctional diguanylate cyclase/phosphodiesterase [Haloechinothrix salitolerans]|uniref:Bifunctional diguanylate cyclase/phosphodiesterase n=1 Tax=Haloechinothrix salitolerans TaxID=926830 RepID=A0ABW2C5Z6_9PSEU